MHVLFRAFLGRFYLFFSSYYILLSSIFRLVFGVFIQTTQQYTETYKLITKIKFSSVHIIEDNLFLFL